jgi:hypothetical protein
MPFEGHPWAIRAAVDTNCLAKYSAHAYREAVDQIHKVSSDLGGSERTLAKANEEIDAIALAIESNVSWTSPRFTLASQNKMPALSKNHSWKRTLWVS